MLAQDIVFEAFELVSVKYGTLPGEPYFKSLLKGVDYNIEDRIHDHVKNHPAPFLAVHLASSEKLTQNDEWDNYFFNIEGMFHIVLKPKSDSRAEEDNAIASGKRIAIQLLAVLRDTRFQEETNFFEIKESKLKHKWLGTSRHLVVSASFIFRMSAEVLQDVAQWQA